MPPTAPSSELRAQALAEPYNFRWGICPREHLSIRAWVWGDPSDDDPVVIRCASKAVAQSVVIEHNKAFGPNPGERRRRL